MPVDATSLSNELVIDGRDGQDERSFWHLRFEYVSNHPCTGASIKDATLPMKRQPGEWAFRIGVATSQHQLIDNLDIKASARASFWGAEVQGSASYLRDLTFDQSTVVLTFSAHQQTASRSTDVKKLVFEPDAARCFENAKAARSAQAANWEEACERAFERFYNAYGSFVPDVQTYGSTLTVFMKRSCSNAAELSQVKASMGIQGGVYKVDAQGAKQTAKKLDQLKFDIHAHGRGRIAKVPAGLLALSPSEAIAWAFDTWLQSAETDVPALLSTKLMGIWSLPGADPTFEDFLRGRQRKLDALVDAALEMDDLRTAIDQALNDAERAAPDEAEADNLVNLDGRLLSAQAVIKEHVQNKEYPDVQDVLARHGLADPSLKALRVQLDDWQRKRAPVPVPIERLEPGSTFKLQLHGQSSVYIGKNKDGKPQASGAAHANLFTCDGIAPRLHALIRLRALDGSGDSHYLRCDVNNGNAITFDSHRYNACHWRVVQKRGSAGDGVCYGDLVMLANQTYPRRGIKCVDGKIVGQDQTRHFLRIVKP